MKIIIGLFLLVMVSCSPRISNNVLEKDSFLENTYNNAAAADTVNLKTELIEIFTDSLTIGVKGKNKLELIKHRVFGDTYVIVKFYRKAPHRWYLQNTYLYECNALMSMMPDISDYNNDGLNDVTFISAQAARGANEVRRLFIYDDYKQELISILNSEDYPNMRYNKELDCIDAFLVHGGTSTVFAKIKKDSLIQFASVHNDSHRTIYETDADGKEKLITKEIIDPDNIYVRYSNYKPLKEYQD